GNDVQREAWLDEALASYSEVIYLEQMRGAEAAQAQLEVFRQRYRSVRDAGRDAPVAQPTAAFRGNYYGIVYGKAALFFQALRQQIGEEAFFAFLRDYYGQHRYGYVGRAQLQFSAEQACSCELGGLFEAWIDTVTPLQLP